MPPWRAAHAQSDDTTDDTTDDSRDHTTAGPASMSSQPFTRLSLLVFPHAWDGHSLRGSVLLLPTGDPLHAPLFARGAPFAGLPLTIKLVVTPDDFARRELPISSAGHAVAAAAIQRDASAETKRLFEALHAQFLPTPQASNAHALARQQRQRRARLQALGDVVRHLPRNQLKPKAASGLGLVSESGHGVNVPGCRHVSWGQVLTHALRQPELARALGLVMDFELDFAALGLAAARPAWLHACLDACLDNTSANESSPAQGVVSYATLLPALDGRARSLFAAALFPVHAPLVGPQAEAAFSEASAYDDGFARHVLAAQSPDADLGIALAWDDEQLLRWINRQLHPGRTLSASSEGVGVGVGVGPGVSLYAPVGVAGYRVDARLHPRKRRPQNQDDQDHDRAGWHSLCGARADLAVGAWRIQFDGELWVDVAPHAAHHNPAQAWHLPNHFAVWRGGSLVLPDAAQQALNGLAVGSATASSNPSSTWAVQPLPGHPALPALRYGQQWDFRVRLVDLSGGGPRLGDVSKNAAPASVATLRFFRQAPPRLVRIDTSDHMLTASTPPPDSLFIRRPLLAYPDFGFAGVDATPALLEQLTRHRSAPRSLQHGLGLSDPDVTHLLVAVQVRAPYGDGDGDGDGDCDSDADGDLAARAQSGTGLLRDGDHIELFRLLIPLPPRGGFAVTSHNFDEDEAALALRLVYTDCADVHASASALKVASTNGVLMLPTGRDVRLRCRAACVLKKGRPHHFAQALLHTVDAQCVALGAVADLSRRREEITAAELPVADAHTQLNLHTHTTALWLEASTWPAAAACTEPLQALAAAVGLQASGMRLRGQPGCRVVLAASGRMGHVVEQGGSQIRFSSTHDMTGRWVVAHRVCLQRDWTWSGLMEPGIVIEPMPHTPGHANRPWGSLSLPFAVSRVATQSRAPQRSHTTFIFFDTTEAADVETLNDLDDEAVLQKHRWQARTRLKVPAEVTTDLHVLNLPFARRPRQVPRVLAMGVWSPHSADPNGSADAGAAQTLWIEFERALSVHAAHPTRGLKYFARWCRSDDEEPEFNLTARRAEAGSAWTEISAWSFDRHTQTAENHTTENHLCAAHAMTELAPALPTAHTQPTQVDDAAQTHEVSRWLLPLPLSLPINLKTAAPPARHADCLELRTGVGSAHWTTPNARFSHAVRVLVQHFF